MALSIQKTAAGDVLKLPAGDLMGECCCCPTDAHCADECPGTVHADISTGCTGAPPAEDPCNGIWSWAYADTCRWVNFASPAVGCGTGAIDLDCGSAGNVWRFRIYGWDIDSGYCEYRKGPTDTGCPMGNYTLYGGTCPSCDATATVYS